MKIQTHMRMLFHNPILAIEEDVPVKNRTIPQNPPKEGVFAVQFFDRDMSESTEVRRADDHNFSPTYFWGEEHSIADIKKERDKLAKENKYDRVRVMDTLLEGIKLMKCDRACKTKKGEWVVMRAGDLAFE